jgi:hypothetical protein
MLRTTPPNAAANFSFAAADNGLTENHGGVTRTTLKWFLASLTSVTVMNPQQGRRYLIIYDG